MAAWNRAGWEASYRCDGKVVVGTKHHAHRRPPLLDPSVVGRVVSARQPLQPLAKLPHLLLAKAPRLQQRVPWPRGGRGAKAGQRRRGDRPQRDDYRRPMLVFALRPPPSVPLQPAQQRQHALLEGLSLALLSQRADVYAVVAPPAPHALPLLHWTPGSWYQDSALCAAALDCATLPYRLSGLASAGAPLGAWVCVLGGGQ